MFSLLRFMNIDFLETKNKESDNNFLKIDCLLSLNILYIISLTLLRLELTWKRMKKNSRDTEFHENGDNPKFDFSNLDFWSLFIIKIFNRSVISVHIWFEWGLLDLKIEILVILRFGLKHFPIKMEKHEKKTNQSKAIK